MKTITLALFATAFAAAIHSTHAQLIINGSFETPDTATYIRIGAGQNTIAPWVVGLDSVEVGDAVGNGFLVGPAFDGGQTLDLNGSGRGRLTQAFVTTPGLLYTVTFAYANNYYNSSTPASASVRVFDSLGDRLNQTITHTGSVAGNFHWTVFSQQFTALQTTTSLEFTSLTDTDGHSGGIMLDAVQVVPCFVVPRESFVLAGGSLILGLTNAPAFPSTLQWQFNGTNITGATTATLALSSLTTHDSGSYRVTISNALQVVTTAVATVQVIDRVTIISHPRGTNTPAGSNVTLNVSALSPLPIAYQWRFNGVDLPGQTSPTFTLTNVQFANDGLYTVVATDALGSVTSEPAAVRILIKPVIVQAPLSQSIVTGGSITFSVEITGNPAPFLYQWRQGSTTLTNMVLSDKKAFFSLNNLQTSNAGQYRVLITNAALPALTLNTTWNLTVLPDADRDGLPDAWESAHGLSATDPADAALDSDGDGQTNLGEYRAGTNPTNAASCLKLEGVTHANGTATVSLNAVSNQTYTVEWSANLGGAWTRLTDLVARTNNRVESVTDNTATDAARFYRVLTPRWPW